ncbi:hypothetical protein PZ894_01165 [Nocardioides sp. YIM 152315]|nr:hypothetical protein [Nocardioides sp. YIM 152315]
MLTLRAPLIAVVAVVAVVALAPLTPPPASAGGPTSALLSVPGEGRTASVYYTDPEYDRLADLVGANGGTGPADPSGRTHESGPGVTVTWLIHDVQPWRIDRVYLDAEGGPWISTQVMDGETGSIWDSPVVWHRAASGKELSLLLDRLLTDRTAPAPAPVRAEPPTSAPAAASSAGSSAPVDGVWWGLGGLAAGVLLTVAWLRLRPTREDEPEPDPDADWLVPQTRSTSA